MAWPFSKANDSEDDDYYVVPAIEDDDMIHSEEHPYCPDPRCPCHEDEDNIAQTNQQYQDGLITGSEATRIVKGWWF